MFMYVMFSFFELNFFIRDNVFALIQFSLDMAAQARDSRMYWPMDTSGPDDLRGKSKFWGVEIRLERGEKELRATKVKSERERGLA